MAWLGLWSKPELRVNPQRINDEWRAAHRAALYSEDLVYRAKVMRRMREGLSAQQLAPLIDRFRSRCLERVKVEP